jgi:hypothetical protein
LPLLNGAQHDAPPPDLLAPAEFAEAYELIPEIALIISSNGLK